jgi:hypothetical protein
MATYGAAYPCARAAEEGGTDDSGVEHSPRLRSPSRFCETACPGLLPATRLFSKPLSEDLPSFLRGQTLAILLLPMFLRSTNRRNDGKDHRYFSIVENHRLPGGKSVQPTVLYLGEINDQQQAAWRKTLEAPSVPHRVIDD